MGRQILAITRKELSGYFGSALAIIFIGVFLAAVLFIFFTIETFFARGIADVRPLFRWMPLLLIFLLAALTMRLWSEERRSGTEELLLTLPVRPLYLVLGKFLAVMAIISLALALTLPLPITVGAIGNLDWGPVIGGYLAALLMAAAYAAIGLFVSSRTDNQIVALIVTVLVGGALYLVGTRGVTDFVGGGASEILWAVGTGSRFSSIERGVVDLRDLVYYLSLALFFLALTTISLESVSWSERQPAARRRASLTLALVGLNLLLLNVWLFALAGLRLDLTGQREYSLSPTTKNLFGSLQEPLLMRAYISQKTHPLLAPLAPQIEDMLREYEIAAGGRLTAEVVDPATDPELESEANQTYGIRPTAFQVSDRYEASVINGYFDILVRYGDQTAVIPFDDLIQVDVTPTGPEVSLRNLEYDLTSAIKKVVFGFQSVDAVLAALPEPAHLTAYITSSTLPEDVAAVQATVDAVAREIEAESEGKFVYEVVDLDAPDSPVTPQFLQETYGLQPIPVSFFSPESFYAHLLLQSGDDLQLLYPPADPGEGEIRTALESALKRTSAGFLKGVGIWTPPPDPNAQLGGAQQSLSSYSLIREQLAQEYDVQSVDLSSGQVPAGIDVLLVVAPQNMSDAQLFALDQFLMRGGSVVLALSNSQLSADPFSGGLALVPAVNDNLQAWLDSQGIGVSSSLVLDTQNQAFPVPVTRDVGGFQVQEMQAIDYPFFVDVRPDGMNTESPIVANLPAVTMNYVSPVELDEAANAGRETTVLLNSSPGSWLRLDTSVAPDFDLYPQLGFPVEGEQQSYPLAVAVQGSFDSYFADKPSPFAEAAGAEIEPGATAEPPPRLGTVTRSPESSRLVVIGSSAFAEDDVMNLSSVLIQDRYLNNLQFLQNVVDWSAEDLDLLAIRSRGSSSRVLRPLVEQQQLAWEIGNYAFALVALLGIFIVWRTGRRNEEPMALLPREEASGR